MAKYPYFPFYPHDFLADPCVVCMSLEEQGAYMRLLCHAWNPPQWDAGKAPVGSLPNDKMLLASLSGAGDRWNEMEPAVLRAFHVSDDGRFIVQKRMTEEWEKLCRLSEEQRRKAKKGAEIRSRGSRTPAEPQPNPSRTPAGIEPRLESGCPSAPAEFSQSESDPEPHTDLPPSPPPGGKKKRPRKEADPASPLPFAIDEALRVLTSRCSRVKMPADFDSRDGRDVAALIRAFYDIADWERVGDWLGAGGMAFIKTVDINALKARFGTFVTCARDWDAEGRPDPNGQRPKDIHRGQACDDV